VPPQQVSPPIPTIPWNQHRLPPRPAPPADPRHQRFAVLFSKGRFLADAYQQAGFQCFRATAYVNSHRLSRKSAVADYIAALIRQEFKTHEEAMEIRRKAEAERNFQFMRSMLRR
jgi:hypothetical protein